MKKQLKRLERQPQLTLDRETVQRLDREDLGAAEGGYNYSTGAICHTYTKLCG
jgi:hypothetical protein